MLPGRRHGGKNEAYIHQVSCSHCFITVSAAICDVSGSAVLDCDAHAEGNPNTVLKCSCVGVCQTFVLDNNSKHLGFYLCMVLFNT